MNDQVFTRATGGLDDIDRTLASLRSRFFTHRNYHELQSAFTRLIKRRRADLELGGQKEAHGIAVIGDSGSGKTTAVRRLFTTYPDLQTLESGVETFKKKIRSKFSGDGLIIYSSNFESSKY